jgi:aspartate racemase
MEDAHMAAKSVGVIGGMGPEATVDLMRRVIQATPAQDDSDHIRMIVDNNPKVPSRIKAVIEGTGESPAPILVQMGRKLEAYGADFLVIPCNTAHYYLNDIRSAVSIPVIDMIELTVDAVLREHPALKSLGLLASQAVLQTGLYMKRFGERGVNLIYPQDEIQNSLMSAIRTIKTGCYGTREKRILRSAADNMIQRGAETLIVACTELSLIADALDPELKVYDSAQILAEAVVRIAKEET